MKTRNIKLKTSGQSHGPINRLISPGDLGDYIKPFVFLDYVQMENFSNGMFAAHPHSGIATLTTYLSGDELGYRDSTGASGNLYPGSVEWIQAGSGMWHWTHSEKPSLTMKAYQLWLALPPELELEPAKTLYLESGSIEGTGPFRVLLGNYKNFKSSINYPRPITLLHVRLRKDEHWTFQPSDDHDIAWLAVHDGILEVSDKKLKDELVIFEDGNEYIEIKASSDTNFIIASAKRHPYPLVLGTYSVHTSIEALKVGLKKIAEVKNSPLVQEALKLSNK